jgi:uncharacterized protein (AIM24 family)
MSDFQDQSGRRLDLPEPTVVASGEGKTGMDYQIVGTTMQAVIIQLEPGQTIFSETGGMAWMSGNVTMNQHRRRGRRRSRQHARRDGQARHLG